MSDPLWPTPQVDGMDRALRVWKPKQRPTCSQSWTGCFLIDARDIVCDSPTLLSAPAVVCFLRSLSTGAATFAWTPAESLRGRRRMLETGQQPPSEL